MNVAIPATSSSAFARLARAVFVRLAALNYEEGLAFNAEYESQTDAAGLTARGRIIDESLTNHDFDRVTIPIMARILGIPTEAS